MDNVKLAFICDMPKEHFPFWEDGLRAALSYLAEKYQWTVNIFNIPSMERVSVPDTFDFYLFWGSLPQKQHSRRLFKKQGLCFGGGTTEHPHAANFDVIFAESSVDIESFRNQGFNAKKAFGTNTQIMRPIHDQPKMFDAIYPAAFAAWKHQEVFAAVCKQYGWKGLAFGYMQPDNPGETIMLTQACLSNNVAVMSWVPYRATSFLINASNRVLITADGSGGSQRAMLEAKACNVPALLLGDSPKLRELDPLTHEEVLRDWSEVSYAEQLREGIEACLTQ